jgi:hypothetical protein
MVRRALAMKLTEAIKKAQAADAAYAAVVHALGFKSRWDVRRSHMLSSQSLSDAYEAKVAADQMMHEAFKLAAE